MSSPPDEAHAMPRAAFLLPLLLFAPGLAAPVPKELKKPTDYFPVAVGTRWEYVQEATGKLDHAREVTDSAADKGTTTATFKWTSHAGAYTATSMYRIEGGVVNRLGWSATELFAVPNTMWKTDAKPGEKWVAGIIGPQDPKQYTNTRGEEEEVKTPAGTFRAVPVTFHDGREANIYWYAPGVGMVKWRQGNGTAIVLSKFTAGKDARK